jgi:hypothetical protein
MGTDATNRCGALFPVSGFLPELLTEGTTIPVFGEFGEWVWDAILLPTESTQ